MKANSKQYSPAYWTKNALRHESSPEGRIVHAVQSYSEDPATCPVAFQGTPHELLNTLYLEWRKQMKSVHLCLFPTPMETAIELAAWMKVGPGDIVFDPGCGTGNLLVAAEAQGAKSHGMEFQYWIPPLLNDIGIQVQRGDFLDYPNDIARFTHVMVNPPYGRAGTSSDATTDFMARLADICPAGTPVGAILPSGHFNRDTKHRRATAARFDFRAARTLPPGTFAPLTKVETCMLLLTVK